MLTTTEADKESIYSQFGRKKSFSWREFIEAGKLPSGPENVLNRTTGIMSLLQGNLSGQLNLPQRAYSAMRVKLPTCFFSTKTAPQPSRKAIGKRVPPIGKSEIYYVSFAQHGSVFQELAASSRHLLRSAVMYARYFCQGANALASREEMS